MNLCMTCKFMRDCPVTEFGANLGDALIIVLSQCEDLQERLSPLLGSIKEAVIDVSEVEGYFNIGVGVIDCEGYEPRG